MSGTLSGRLALMMAAMFLVIAGIVGTVSQRIAHAIVQRIEQGTDGEDAALEAIAGEFELSSRQIRRMFDLVGHPVTKLRREAIGPIRDRLLSPGSFRDLAPEEVAALKAIRPAPPKVGRAAAAGPAAADPSAPPAPGRKRWAGR